MSTITAMCQTCGTGGELDAEDILVRVSEAEPWGAGCLYACPSCGVVIDAPLDTFEVAMLLAAGAVVTASHQAPAGPVCAEPRTAGEGLPPLCADDLLDLHALLATADWFDALVRGDDDADPADDHSSRRA
jgi:hypothetical protein